MPLYLSSLVFWDHFSSCPSKSLFFFSSLFVLCFPLPCSFFFRSTLYFSSSSSLPSQPYELPSRHQVVTARQIAKISSEGNIASATKAVPVPSPHVLLPKCFGFTRRLLNETGRRRDSPEFLVQSPKLSTFEASPDPYDTNFL